jgi:hypothetical protein
VTCYQYLSKTLFFKEHNFDNIPPKTLAYGFLGFTLEEILFEVGSDQTSGVGDIKDIFSKIISYV